MVKVTSTSHFGSAVKAFTSNSRSMSTLLGHVGVTFKPTTGITTTVVEQSLGEAANLEFNGAYHADSFTQTDVMIGKWNFADIEVFSVCWDNVNLGELVHFKGKLGEFKDYQTHFTCEARGYISLLSEDVNIVTSRLCRVKDFRDSECGHASATVTISAVSYNVVHTGTTAASNAATTQEYIVITSASYTGTAPPDGFFTNGKITGTSGANNGVSREISYSVDTAVPNTRIYLKRPFPYDITAGETFTLTAGCNRTLEDCKKFSNAANFRGEAFIPGLEQITKLPTASS
jgi:uncharacterized phage protein (TIGR02218 family)